MEGQWLKLRQSSNNVERAAWLVAMVVGSGIVLLGGTWYMRGIAVPTLALTMGWVIFIRGTGPMTAKENLWFRIWAIALLFFLVGPWIPATMMARYVVFAIIVLVWFGARPINRRKGLFEVDM